MYATRGVVLCSHTLEPKSGYIRLVWGRGSGGKASIPGFWNTSKYTLNCDDVSWFHSTASGGSRPHHQPFESSAKNTSRHFGRQSEAVEAEIVWSFLQPKQTRTSINVSDKWTRKLHTRSAHEMRTYIASYSGMVNMLFALHLPLQVAHDQMISQVC